MTDLPTEYLTLAQTAQLLQKSKKQIYHMVSRGQLTPGKAGGSLRFTREQIHRDLFGKRP